MNRLNIEERIDRLGMSIPSASIKLPGRFERNAVIATVHTNRYHPQVDVYLRATYNVAFDEKGPAGGEPVVQTLDNIRKVVGRRVIPAFARFFPRRGSPRPPSPRDRRAR